MRFSIAVFALLAACSTQKDDGRDASVPWDKLECTPSTPCTQGECCSGTCAVLSKDPDNCGACGVRCPGSKFCNGAGCSELALAGACENPRAILLLDGEPVDDEAGRALADVFAQACPRVNLRQASTGARDVLAEDGRPLAGPGDTLLSAGGAFLQPSVRFMESASTPVFTRPTENGARMQIVARKTGAVLVDVAVSELTAERDWFVVQLAVDEASGALALMAYGLYPAGTTAAAVWVQRELAPRFGQDRDLYGIYSWRDTDRAWARARGISSPGSSRVNKASRSQERAAHRLPSVAGFAHIGSSSGLVSSPWNHVSQRRVSQKYRGMRGAMIFFHGQGPSGTRTIPNPGPPT